MRTQPRSQFCERRQGILYFSRLNVREIAIQRPRKLPETMNFPAPEKKAAHIQKILFPRDVDFIKSLAWTFYARLTHNGVGLTFCSFFGA